MKKKIFNILGVAVTVAMVLALGAAFSAAPAAGAVEKLNEWYTFSYPDEGSNGDWFRAGSYDSGEFIYGLRELTQAINGDLYVYAYLSSKDSDEILKSEDGGRSWALTKYSDPVDGVEGGRIFDMVCSSIDADVVYATDGCYVYKTEDGGDTWTFLAQDSLETELGGACGCPICACTTPNWRVITSIDVTYDADDNPYVFIGTRAHTASHACNSDCVDGTYPGDVLYISEAGYPANWTSLNLPCFHSGGYDAIAVGCAPDWADSHETYVVVTTDADGLDGYDHTWVVYTKGTVCGWYDFAELLWDCKPAGSDEGGINGNFKSLLASRIGFPDDWADTETLFVGVTSFASYGGDVYMAADGDAIDMNVEGIGTGGGCVGKVDDTDILSLDICGDTDDAALIAGEFSNTNVWYSTDGGWSWDVSTKNPTGEQWTYVIWYGDCAESALAATWGCECAVSKTCTSDDVEDVGEAWNQISLIATRMQRMEYLGFSPGFVCGDSETMYMVSKWEKGTCDYRDTSLWRYDGTYWERVLLGFYDTTWDEPDSHFDWVFVSPDFNETNALYVASHKFGIWRSTDAGCSWDQLTFPCAPRTWISTAVVIDEDTVIVGGRYCSEADHNGEGYVYKTTRHGARLWKDYQYYDYPTDTYARVISFALEPGYTDPGSILLGDSESQVFISEDGGENWDLVGTPSDVFNSGEDTWVIFDPGYATNHIIYAAAGDMIARCVIDPEADWADQEWEEIFCLPTCPEGAEFNAAGIAVAGDTALYVTDGGDVETETELCDEDTVETSYINGGVLRSLNPGVDEEGEVIDAEDVVFERITDGLVFEDYVSDPNIYGTELDNLWLTCDTSEDGCAETVLWSLDTQHPYGDTTTVFPRHNVWVYEDTLAQPVSLINPADEQKVTKTDEATLSWEELCDADCYEVSLYAYCAECPDNKLTVDLSDLAAMDCCPVDDVACGPELECPADVCTEDTCIVVDGLDPGTTYYWQVRVCQGKPTLSKWSELRSFTTALSAVEFEELCSPACGSQDIILTPNFAWGAVDGATGYEVGLSTTDTFTAVVAGGATEVNAWVCPTTLEYATTYYWRVRAIKDTIYSDWTYCMFTTMPEPVAPTPPVVVEQVPPSAPPVINIPPAEMITPKWIYAVIAVGAALAIVVIVLIVRTRRPPA
jgi:hypothetical protein